MKRFHIPVKLKKRQESVAAKTTILTLILMFFFNISLVFSQNSQQQSVIFKSISPQFDHYERFGLLPIQGKNAPTDTLRFPQKDFRRMAYLKLRTIYLQVPISFFKIKPFPANSSEQTKGEIDFLLELQSKRTPEIMAQTDKLAEIYHDPFTNNPHNEDYERNINSLFHIGKDLGSWYNVRNLPQTNRILQNVIQDATYYFFTLKSDFARPRPYQLSTEIKNPEAPGHSSFPSGHSSASYVNAFLLAEIFPQFKEIFLGNAYDMAFSREIRGVHYPSDSQAGKDFAQQFIKRLLKEKSFKQDFEKMKNELTNAFTKYKN